MKGMQMKRITFEKSECHVKLKKIEKITEKTRKKVKNRKYLKKKRFKKCFVRGKGG